jgi:hypothetical protein
MWRLSLQVILLFTATAAFVMLAPIGSAIVVGVLAACLFAFRREVQLRRQFRPFSVSISIKRELFVANGLASAETLDSVARDRMLPKIVTFDFTVLEWHGGPRIFWPHGPRFSRDVHAVLEFEALYLGKAFPRTVPAVSIDGRYGGSAFGLAVRRQDEHEWMSVASLPHAAFHMADRIGNEQTFEKRVKDLQQCGWSEHVHTSDETGEVLFRSLNHEYFNLDWNFI